MCNSKVILSTSYFPAIQYFSKIVNYNDVFIEKYENFSKQSYRNRCEILTANGKQSLTIPIEKLKTRTLITDVKIDYKNNWQSLHFKSLQSAYLSSPFYEFYIDIFKIFFEKKFKYLFDFNIEILQTLLAEIQLQKTLNFTNIFKKDTDYLDFRNSIHPKKKFKIEDENFQDVKYEQVFSNKFSFVENLSILDLLFNEGPNTLNILKQTFVK